MFRNLIVWPGPWLVHVVLRFIGQMVVGGFLAVMLYLGHQAIGNRVLFLGLVAAFLMTLRTVLHERKPHDG